MFLVTFWKERKGGEKIKICMLPTRNRAPYWDGISQMEIEPAIS